VPVTENTDLETLALSQNKRFAIARGASSKASSVWKTCNEREVLVFGSPSISPKFGPHGAYRSRGRTPQGRFDELRPHTRGIWRRLPLREKRRFVGHLEPYRDIHRNHIAPEIGTIIESMNSRVRLHLAARRIISAPPPMIAAHWK
jgi:hypothetical protein